MVWRHKALTLANLITLVRLLLVPFILWALLTGAMVQAFVLFLVAGVSDAVDGLIARAMGQQSELGTLFDPIADKILLVSVFIVLGVLGHIPLWLVILVVSRDFFLLIGIVICFLIRNAIEIHPVWLSKANTLSQIFLVSFILGSFASQFDVTTIIIIFQWLTAFLTVASAIHYLLILIRHLSGEEVQI